MNVTRAWRVYGAEGHRQRESFSASHEITFSREEWATCKIAVLNADVTGTNEYSLVIITGESAEACERRLMGQVDDGVFENCRVGKVKELRRMYDLSDTAALMLSSDYRIRFAAEYLQVKLRCERLAKVVEDQLQGTASFKVTCPAELLQKQLADMQAYLRDLCERGNIEGINLLAVEWCSMPVEEEV